MIEKASFDTKKSYTLIPKPVKVVQVSSSSETDESNNNVDDHDDDKEHSGDELFKIQDRSTRSPIKLRAGRELKHTEEFSLDFKRLKVDSFLEKLDGINDNSEWIEEAVESRTSSLEYRKVKIDRINEDFNHFNSGQDYTYFSDTDI